jgi:hypothetical protein
VNEYGSQSINEVKMWSGDVGREQNKNDTASWLNSATRPLIPQCVCLSMSSRWGGVAVPSALDWFRLRRPHYTAVLRGLLFEGRLDYDEQRRLSTMLPACGHRCIRVFRAIGPRNMSTPVWTALTWPVHYQPTREGCMLGYCPDILANGAAACWC